MAGFVDYINLIKSTLQHCFDRTNTISLVTHHNVISIFLQATNESFFSS